MPSFTFVLLRFVVFGVFSILQPNGTLTMPSSPITQHTLQLRKAARAIDALCGVPGKTDPRNFTNTALFVAYVQPVLKTNGFTPVVPFSEADVDEAPACVARYSLTDDGETLLVDILHNGTEGWLMRSWIKQESRGLDLRDFMPLAA